MAGTHDEGSGVVRPPVKFTPMEVPKASDVLANELRERILDGELSEGTALPPERELVAQTRMSRATVREALRTLQIQGLVQIKAGRAGGTFVQRPGRDSVAKSVSLLIRGQQFRLAALLETRQAIEPFCARLAARNRTDSDLARLDEANEALADQSANLARFLQANVDWHVAVAIASHNELLAGMMTGLSRAIYTSTENERFVDDKVRHETLRAHLSITEAIRAQDPDAAVRRMERHVSTYAKAVLEVEERIEISVPDTE
jgi:GntR family transcriptional regulator, transcriptional repressor for pyruvate dehydrogenase complex